MPNIIISMYIYIYIYIYMHTSTIVYVNSYVICPIVIVICPCLRKYILMYNLNRIRSFVDITIKTLMLYRMIRSMLCS